MRGGFMDPSPAPTRFWSVDYLRGCCALSVLASHLVVWVDFSPRWAAETAVWRVLGAAYDIFTQALWPTGAQHPGVACFFVLSGFCVHWQFVRLPGNGHPAWAAYFRRRLRRIMPVYWAATILGALLVWAERTHPTGNAFLGMHTAGGWSDLLARVGGWTCVWPREVYWGNMPLTTVGAELAIYAAYPAFFALAASGRWKLLGALTLALQGVALALEPQVNPVVLFTGPLVMAWLWFLGALAARLVAEGRTAVRGWWIGAAWLLFQGVKGLPRFYAQSLLKQVVFGAVCALAILWLVEWQRRRGSEPKVWWSRFLGWTGGVSYSLYAVHTPAIFFATWLLINSGCQNYALQLVLATAATLALTWAVHHGIERQFYRGKAMAVR